MKKFIIAAFLLTTSLTAGATLAADNKPQVSPAEQAEARGILDMARGLVNYGEAKNDPLALVTAAKMYTSVPGRVLADGEKGSGGKALDVEAVLKKAEELSQGDELIAKVAKDVRAAAAAQSKAVCWYELWCNNYTGACWYEYYCAY
jgi:hypothetical protein